MLLMFLFIQLLLFLIIAVLLSSLIIKRKVAYFIIIAFFSLFMCFQFSAIYFGGSLVDYKFIIHLRISNIFPIIKFYRYQVYLLISIYISVFAIIFWSSKLVSNYIMHNKTFTFLTIAVSAILMMQPGGVFYVLFSAVKIIGSATMSFNSSLECLGIDHNFYIEPKQVNAVSGKNIIVFSLESYEKGYLEHNFADLTPNIRRLAKENAFYEMTEEYGSSWTSASIYTLITGTPAYFKGFGNDLFQNTTSTRITGVGHVLRAAGYNLTYIMGNPEFGGLKEFLQSSGFDVISEKNLNSKYKSTMWGLMDFDLFHELKKIVLNKKKSNKPFAIFISTNSTHAPDGIYDERMVKFISPKLSNLEFMVAAKDFLINDFINFLKKEDLLTNTVLFLFPDHLLMGKDSRVINEFVSPRGLFLLTTASKNKLTFNLKEKINQIDLPKIILEGAEISHNAKFLTDYINEDPFSFIRKNISNIVALNESSLIKNDTISFILIKQLNNKVSEIRIEENKEIFNRKIKRFYIESNQETKEHIFELKHRMVYGTGFYPFVLDSIIYFDNIVSNLSDFKFNNESLYLVYDSYKKNNFAYLQFKSKKLKKKISNNIISFTKEDINSLLENDSIYLRSHNKESSYIKAPRTKMILNNNLEESKGLVLLTESNNNYLLKYFNTNYDSIDALLFINELKKLSYRNNFFALVKNDSCMRYLKHYKKQLINYGFEKLANLNDEKNYIAYNYKGFISEYVSIEPIEVELSEKPTSSLRSNEQIVKDSKDINKFIAHAGGVIDDITYTNSLEALNLSYKKGFRLFELDIIQTSDSVYVAAHDWDYWTKITGYKGSIPVSLSEFMKHKIHGRYTPMDIHSINAWFKSHKDAILITDKINEPNEFASKFIDKNRLMMELFTIEAVKEGVSIGIRSAMPSEHLVFNNNSFNINEFVELGVKNLAVSRRYIESNKSLFLELKKNGINVYVYHVNFDKGKNETYVLCNDFDYVYGMYADDWIF